MGCGCEKKEGKHFPSAVLEIKNPEQLVLLRKVVIPATLGDDTTVEPIVGKYRNVILYYEANKHTYIYSSDGIPTYLETEIPQELLDRITELEDGLADEAEARAAADERLSEAIADERAAREAADAAEAAARAQAISDEASARTTADATLQSNITAEATARANADTTLQTNIDNLSTALTTETTNRTNADTALGARIDGVAGDLATETANRQAADTGLQSQIDAIVASSDVKDIVGTYAALQQYDTSTLGNDDIIKVLQDETHSGETTYYRWSAATSTFTLIGEEGPYYTKSATDTLLDAKADKATTYTKTEVDTALATKADQSTTYTKTEVDTALATKQDNLIAGANISIASDGKTISATDTTYSPFTGTDGTAAGTAGLVPAPATADVGKMLGANGTWVTGPTKTSDLTNDGEDGTHSYLDTTFPFKANSLNKSVCGGYDSGNLSKSGAVALGDAASAQEIDSVAIGARAKASGSHSIAIGSSNSGQGTFPLASDTYGIAIGGESRVGGGVVGAQAHYGVAIGRKASINSNGDCKYSVALGAYSRASYRGQVDISTSESNGGGYGYNGSDYRLLTGLYDPQSDHDAATKGYVDTAVAGAGTGGSIIANNDFITMSNGYSLDVDSYVYQYGKLIIASLVVRASNGGDFSTVPTVGVINSQYRPLYHVSAICSIGDFGISSGVTGFALASTSGVLDMGAPGTTSDYGYINLVYPIA